MTAEEIVNQDPEIADIVLRLYNLRSTGYKRRFLSLLKDVELQKRLESGDTPMTEAQAEYINDICYWLCIDYDGDSSASAFINKYAKDVKKVRKTREVRKPNANQNNKGMLP